MVPEILDEFVCCNLLKVVELHYRCGLFGVEVDRKTSGDVVRTDVRRTTRRLEGGHEELWLYAWNDDDWVYEVSSSGQQDVERTGGVVRRDRQGAGSKPFHDRVEHHPELVGRTRG